VGYFRKAPLAVLIVITLVIGIGMVYFGIRFKGYRPVNNAELLPTLGGLNFQKFGIAYTHDFFAGGGQDSGDGLAIEMGLRTEKMVRPTFALILSVHGGDDARQLVIGQWRDSLVIMNGDDYDGKKGVRKLYVDIGPDLGEAIWLSIRSGTDGTHVYIDGELVKSNPKLHLYYPNRTGDARLVIGNSVHGRHGWHGLVSGLAMYDHVLSELSVQSHYAQWVATGDGDWLDEASAPEILYRFDRKVDGRIINQAGNDYHLQVPGYMKILQKEFLQWHRLPDGPRWALVQDMVVNLVGFIPLGFMLCAILVRFKGGIRKNAWLVTVGLAFVFSLSLEVTQAWIPSRDSSGLDLILNTIGAAVGAWTAKA